METLRNFIFLGSKITVDGDCNPEIKRCLFHGIKAITKLDSILKSSDVALTMLWQMLTKVCLVKAIVFPVVTHGCECWIIKKKKAEHWKINAFDLWCWRRLLKVPWTARISNKSILKEIDPEYSWKDWGWSWSSNTLATCCEELTHWKRPRYYERLKAAGKGNDIGWDGRMEASLTWWTWVWSRSGRW